MASIPLDYQKNTGVNRALGVDAHGNAEVVKIRGSQSPFVSVSHFFPFTTGTSQPAAHYGPGCMIDASGGGAGAVDLPTGADLDAAFPCLQSIPNVGEGAPGWFWVVANNLGAAAVATLTASAGHTLDAASTAAIADQTTVIIFTRRTAAATYVSRVISRGTH